MSIYANGEIAVTADIDQFEDKNWEMILDYKSEKLDLAKGIYYDSEWQSESIQKPFQFRLSVTGSVSR